MTEAHHALSHRFQRGRVKWGATCGVLFSGTLEAVWSASCASEKLQSLQWAQVRRTRMYRCYYSLHWLAADTRILSACMVGRAGGRRPKKPKFLSLRRNYLQDVKPLKDTFDLLYCSAHKSSILQWEKSSGLKVWSCLHSHSQWGMS